MTGLRPIPTSLALAAGLFFASGLAHLAGLVAVIDQGDEISVAGGSAQAVAIQGTSFADLVAGVSVPAQPTLTDTTDVEIADPVQVDQLQKKSTVSLKTTPMTASETAEPTLAYAFRADQAQTTTDTTLTSSGAKTPSTVMEQLTPVTEYSLHSI